MDELVAWLATQNESPRTYSALADRAIALIPTEPTHAAYLRLIADLSSRFFIAYADEPLPADIGAPALAKIRALVKLAADSRNAPAERQVAALNEIATTVLD